MEKHHVPQSVVQLVEYMYQKEMFFSSTTHSRHLSHCEDPSVVSACSHGLQQNADSVTLLTWQEIIAGPAYKRLTFKQKNVFKKA